MEGLKLEVQYKPKSADVEIISDGVIAFGRSQAGVGEPLKVGCFFRKSSEELIAGVIGRIEFDRLFIEYLWTHPEYRKKGLATLLLRKIEVEAKTKSCIDIFIETLSDENAAFYASLGYDQKAKIENYIPGFHRHIMFKVLDNDRMSKGR